MTLKLYNSLTRRKEEFSPLDPENVRMYVCGPTVYDYAHIGNARPAIVFDVLYRLLRHLYGPEHVTYVRNITDVDDKINARAAQDYPDLPLNEAIRRVTATTERQYHEDVRALGCLEPTHEPRATEHIAEMTAMIERLVANGCAYVADGHVLFEVARAKDYGALSRRSLDEMIAGARVEVAPFKRNPMDFVLWKPSKAGEPSWPSPCGIAAPGRPGWHIECSAMSDKWLWEAAQGSLSQAGRTRPHVFDIHGGGIDLQFPHHENEIAQSRCAFGTETMANVWMHNGFLQVEGHKMSKSLGNFVTIHELLATDKFGGTNWSGSVLRFAMMKTHYRQPIDWTVRSLEIAMHQLDDLFRAAAKTSLDSPSPEVVEALVDDLNIHEAISVLHRIRQGVSRSADSHDPSALELARNLNFLGLDRVDFFTWLEEKNARVLEEAGNIESLLCARNAARAAKNWDKADRIRAELDAMGIVLRDNPDGTTTWEVKR